MIDDVGIDQSGTEHRKELRRRRFTARDTAGQTPNMHAGTLAEAASLDKRGPALYDAAVPEFEHKRAHRVGHLIHEELGRLLIEGLKDPRVGFTTVTEVRLTDDLRSAHVFVSVFGSDSEREATLTGLRAATGYLRRELGHRLKLRYAPDLTFAYDDTLVRAQRLDVLLSAARRGDSETPGASAIEALPPVQTGRVMPTPVPPVKKVKSVARKRRKPRKSYSS